MDLGLSFLVFLPVAASLLAALLLVGLPMDRVLDAVASGAADAGFVRACMIEGQVEAAVGDFDAAVRAFERVAELDVDYLPEILSPLLDCYARSQRKRIVDVSCGLLGCAEESKRITAQLMGVDAAARNSAALDE